MSGQIVDESLKTNDRSAVWMSNKNIPTYAHELLIKHSETAMNGSFSLTQLKTLQGKAHTCGSMNFWPSFSATKSYGWEYTISDVWGSCDISPNIYVLLRKSFCVCSHSENNRFVKKLIKKIWSEIYKAGIKLEGWPAICDQVFHYLPFCTYF